MSKKLGVAAFVLSALAGLAAVSLALRATQSPFIWITLYWSGFFLAVSLAFRGGVRTFGVNLLLLLLFFLCAEGFFAYRERAAAPALAQKAAAPVAEVRRPRPTEARNVGQYSDPGNYFKDDWLLGYGPKKNIRVTSKWLFGDEVVYDVVYAIDQNGLRVIDGPKPTSGKAALFFGDSYTFGEGVNGDQSYPARFAQQSAGSFAALNFAFHGYGPHHMLRRIESEGERKAVGSLKPEFAFYQLIPDHVYRAAGKASWDLSGPRYELEASGRPVHKGAFNSLLWIKIERRLSRSFLFKWVAERWRNRRPSESGEGGGEIARTVAILAESRRILEDRYGLRFFVIYWSKMRDANEAELSDAMRKAGLHVLRVDGVLPGYRSDPTRYEIRHDGHPTAKAHAMVGKYLWNLVRR